MHLICPIIVFSQGYNSNFTRIGIYQGLSENHVTSIIQDDLGYLWIGTSNGLNRYDGYAFKTFKFQKQGNKILSSFINKLFKDNNGNIWIATNDGLQCFDPRTESFTLYQHSENDPTSLINNEISDIYSNSEDVLWIGSKDGLSCFNLLTKTFKNFKPYPNNPNFRGFNDVIVMTYNTNKLYFGTNYEVLSFDLQSKTFKTFKYKNYIAVRALCFYDKNKLLIGSQGYGLLSLDITNGHFTEITKIGNYEMPGRTFYSILKLKNGIYFTTNNNGLIYASDLYSNAKVINYKNNDANPSSISSNTLSCLLYDNSGNLWIGSQHDGFCKLNIETKPFKNYVTPIFRTAIQSPPAVRAIFELDNTTLLFGTLGSGLLIYDRKTDLFNSIKFTHGRIFGEAINRITSIYKTKQDYFLLGTEGAGLYIGKLNQSKLNNQTKLSNVINLSTFSKDKQHYIPSNYIMCLLEDSRSNIWVGTWGGLILFQQALNGEPNIRNYFYNNPKDSNTISNNQILCFFEGSNGIIWAGTRKGLNKFTLLKNGKYSVKSYYVNSKVNTGLICDIILSIREDTNNHKVLWIGTQGGGIAYFDTEREIFTNYTIDEKIGNNNISGILEDTNGNFWLGTSKGILMFDTYKRTFFNYYENTGIRQFDFNLLNSCIKTYDNEFYFGNTSGFTSFKPLEIKQRTFVPQVVISGFNIQNKMVPIGEAFDKRIILEKSVSYTKSINIKHNENAFSFEFASLDYYSPDKIQYAYKLDGFDKDWVYTNSDKRFATYSNLLAGSYIFMVKGTNSDGIWNNNPTILRVKILPPWWNTWWAKLLYTIFIVSVISFYIRYRIKLNELKNNLKFEHFEREKLSEVHQMKLRFFANISHEFRTPLTLVIAPLDKLLSKSGLDTEIKYQLEVMRNNINRLLRLINQILDLAKAESDQIKLNPKTGDIINYVKILMSSFHLKAEQQSIGLSFSSDCKSYIVSFDHDIIEKIVYNLLSNAFNHTPQNGTITISVSTDEPDIIELKVKDTGVGIPVDLQKKIFERFFQVDNNQEKERKGTGLGLSLVKALVDINKGTIDVNSVPGQGAEFIVKLPVSKPTSDISVVEVSTKRKESSTQSVEPILSTSGSSSNLKTMLVVEDNTEMRKYISKNFEANNGLTGLELARNNMPDIIISDIMMPEMDGMEFCKEIRTDARTSHIPVLMLTALDTDESRIEGIETGADSYLTKPFNIRHLEASVRALIASREKLRLVYSQKLLIDPSEVTVTSTDEKFLRKLIELIEDKMNEPNFNIESICEELSMSRTNLHHKIKALTGQTSSEFLRTFRIKRAGQLLQKGMTVSETMYAIGINSRPYFIKSFKEIFGMLPSEYGKNEKN
jgi:signal transduction histidine kinase/CheY-like chemotaxis protein/AraC-like DNA-binding protein